jgi:hypothetical protein
VRDTVLICAAAIAQLSEEDQRLVIACLMAGFELGELRQVYRPH